MYKKLAPSDTGSQKVMILYFEGVLINFSENLITFQSEAEAQEKSRPQKDKRLTERQHTFVPSPGQNTKTDRPIVHELYTRPFASMFLQVCKTRFDIHLVHSYPDYVGVCDAGGRSRARPARSR